ncbi:MAG: hypothetical protein AB8B51_12490 [Sedimentitalea sp.]
MALVALLCAGFYKSNPLSAAAEGYARDVAISSAAVYITLRSINAFLSTAQEIEMGGALVVSGTAQPFKVLEPIDDTIERIAQLVFFVMVATGVLAVAMGPVGAVGLVLIALALGVAALRGTIAQTRGLAVYGLGLGVAVPLAFVMSSLLADRVTADVWAENEAILQAIVAEVDTPIPEGATGWSTRFQSVLGEVERYQTLAANISTQADALIRSFIAILAVFVFKLIVLPLVMLGGLLIAIRAFSRLAP